MLSLFGPDVGRRNELTLLLDSGWNEKSEENMVIDGDVYYINVEVAYLLRLWFQKAFMHTIYSVKEDTFFNTMIAVRVSVEHTYKNFKQHWTENYYSRNIKSASGDDFTFTQDLSAADEISNIFMQQ